MVIGRYSNTDDVGWSRSHKAILLLVEDGRSLRSECGDALQTVWMGAGRQKDLGLPLAGLGQR